MTKELWWILLSALAGVVFVLLGFLVGSAAVFAAMSCR
jgi:hypothetical protein